jgi:hypothetical protein
MVGMMAASLEYMSAAVWVGSMADRKVDQMALMLAEYLAARTAAQLEHSWADSMAVSLAA